MKSSKPAQQTLLPTPFPLLPLIILICLYSCTDPQKQPPTSDLQPPTSSIDSVALVKAQILKDSLNPELWQQLYQMQMAKGDTAGGLGSLKFYTLLVPENGDAWLELAWLLADQKNPQVLTVADSLQKVPDVRIQSTAKYLTGVYYSNIGQSDRAIAIFDSVILNNYTFIDAYMEKGIIQHEQQKYAAALKTFQQAFLIKKNDPEIYQWISRCYEGLGDKAQAEDWKKKYEAMK